MNESSTKPSPEDAASTAADEPRPKRKSNFLQLAGAVFWSFFGVRRSAHYAEDVKNLNPVHVIIAGVIGAVIFVVALMVIVNVVISSGVATA